MPIRPKHPAEGNRPVAQRQFTDREDFIAAFDEALAEAVTAEPRALVYYGVGGIGKTSLRKELNRQLAARSGYVSASLDFDIASFQEPETALFVLRKALRDRYKVQFPSFDIAYAVYWQKVRPQVPLTRDNFPLLESGTVLSDLLDVLGNLTVVGLIPKLAGIALKSSQPIRDWWTKRGSKELRDLPGMEPVQIAERLPMFWAADLKDYLAAKQSRAVLFLDTYEALSEGERTEARVLRRDDWVRELVSQLPQVLWVICGRERLRWEESDPDWTKCLSQHLVGGLAEADARQFLQSCGITESAIQQVIVEGSQGLPYFLDLAVDTWVEIQERKNKTPTAADFARTPREVLARFLRHLTQFEVETLKVLAVPRFWHMGLFERLVTEFQTGYPLTAFDDLCRFSFLNEGAAADTWTMHQLMRQSLQEHASPELVKRVHRLLFELYDGQLKDIDIKNITDRQKAALAEAFYHGRATMPVQEFFHWFLKPAGLFRKAAQWRLLIPLYEQVEHDLEAELGPEHPDVAANLNSLAGLLRAQAKYAEAEPLHRRALAIREKVLGPEHPEVAHSLCNLALLLHTQGKYAEAEPLHRRALAIRERVLGPEHLDVAESLNNLAMLLYMQGKYAEAEPQLRRALVIFEQALGSEHPDFATGLANLAMLLQAMGRHAEAEPLHRRSLAIKEKVLGSEHAAVATSLAFLAVVLETQGNYVEAEPLSRRCLAINEKVLGPEHPSVARSLGNLAGLLAAQGKQNEAEPLFRRTLGVLEKALGPEHPDVATTLLRLADLLHGQGRDAEAEPLYRRAPAIYEKALGPGHPHVAASLNGLANLLKARGKCAEAEPLYRHALAIREKALGPEHPDVAVSLNNLAKLMTAQGMHAEAEPLYSRALAIREKALGPDHPRTAEVLENLMKLYDQTGRSEEARRLEERAKQIRARKT
jgi:tetratricopeptide (TPR) repeat protein